jgi:hypothetical protein
MEPGDELVLLGALDAVEAGPVAIDRESTHRLTWV